MNCFDCCESTQPDSRDGCRWCRLYGFTWWIALLLAAASIMVTLYGERHYAQEIQTLQPLLKNYTPSPCSPLQQNDRRLVHIDCPITAMDVFYPPAAFAPNLSQFNGVFFEVQVEMFQHVHKIGAVGPYFFAQWVDHLVDLSSVPSMLLGTSQNPDFFPVVPGRGRTFSTTLKAGGFVLPSLLLTKFRKKQLLPLVDDGYYTPSETRPPPSVDYKNTVVKDNALYTGDPDNPQIGDLRVTFWGSAATHISLIGLQIAPLLGQERFIVEFESPSLKNGSAAIFAEGDYSPEDLVTEYVAQTHASNRATWALRGASVLLLWLWLTFTAFTCCEQESCCLVLVNCALTAMGVVAAACAVVWWAYDLIVSISLFALAATALFLIILIWLGNWREEVAEYDEERKNFQAKKASGELLVIKRLTKLNRSLQPTTLSFSADGCIHFGQHVMLMNQRTGGTLCTDVSDMIQKPAGVAFGCTTGPNHEHTTRNTFEVCSRNQEVVFSSTASGGTLWKVLHADARVRYEHEGRPVPANTTIVIKHVHTDQMLASAKVNYPNSFGSEYEVHCKSYLLHNKTQNLVAESCGRTTSDIDSRKQDEENNWMFVTSITPNPSTCDTNTGDVAF